MEDTSTANIEKELNRQLVVYVLNGYLSMISKYTFISLLTFSVFIACNSGRNKLSDFDSSATDTNIVSQTIESETPKTFKGLYIPGDGINTFIDCAEPGKIYRVKDSTGELQSLYHETTSHYSYPSESVYAELEGYFSAKKATEHENVLLVTHVTKMEAKSFRTNCYDYEFIALGNEPFWETDIIPAEKRIVLKDMSTEKIFDFPYNAAVITGGFYHYEISDGKGNELNITIHKESCSDGMSDRTYHYSSEVSINGRTLKGCAIKKGEKFTDTL